MLYQIKIFGIEQQHFFRIMVIVVFVFGIKIFISCFIFYLSKKYIYHAYSDSFYSSQMVKVKLLYVLIVGTWCGKCVFGNKHQVLT